MTQEELIISEAKKHYSGNIRCYDAFLHGAQFAEEHPINVWHDASEEPKYGEIILVEVINTLSKEDEVNYYVEYSKEWVINSMKTDGFICRWAYISDLLPKGDGNDTKNIL